VARRRSQEKTGLYIFTCFSYGGAGRKRKIGGLAVPMAGASKIAFCRGACRIQLKSGVGIPEMNQKVKPRTGYLINLWSGATGKKIFASIE
jgi:hypothetical protein